MSGSASLRREKSSTMLRAPAPVTDSLQGDRRSRRLSVGDGSEVVFEGKHADPPHKRTGKSASRGGPGRDREATSAVVPADAGAAAPSGGNSRRKNKNRGTTTSSAVADESGAASASSSPSSSSSPVSAAPSPSADAASTRSASEADCARPSQRTSDADGGAAGSAKAKPIVDDPYVATDSTSEPLRIVAQKRYAQKMIAVGPGLRVSPRVRRPSAGNKFAAGSTTTSPSSSAASSATSTPGSRGHPRGGGDGGGGDDGSSDSSSGEEDESRETARSTMTSEAKRSVRDPSAQLATVGHERRRGETSKRGPGP